MLTWGAAPQMDITNSANIEETDFDANLFFSKASRSQLIRSGMQKRHYEDLCGGGVWLKNQTTDGELHTVFYLQYAI